MESPRRTNKMEEKLEVQSAEVASSKNSTILKRPPSRYKICQHTNTVHTVPIHHARHRKEANVGSLHNLNLKDTTIPEQILNSLWAEGVTG